MRVKTWSVLLMSASLTVSAACGAEAYQTTMDRVTAEKVNSILHTEVLPSSGENHGDVISRVSSAFLGTPYQANTLIGGRGTHEVLVANFNGVDCFTLIDYVEALSRSHDEKSFLEPDGGEYILGLGIHHRKINYIPGKAITEQVLSHLKTGDYVGVYSPLEGLDVSHVGIVVRHDEQVWFRNASSLAANKKVVDSPFLEYMRTKPGMVVLRALDG